MRKLLTIVFLAGSSVSAFAAQTAATPVETAPVRVVQVNTGNGGVIEVAIAPSEAQPYALRGSNDQTREQLNQQTEAYRTANLGNSNR